MTNEKDQKFSDLAPESAQDTTPGTNTGAEADALREQEFAAPARPSKKDELIEDIKQLDRQILILLGRRARLSDKAFKTRHQKGPNTAQEMDLWRVWEQDTVKHGGDPKRIRKLFDLVQSLDMQKRPDDDMGAGFLLTPRREKLAVDMPGPPSTFATRLWAVMAARCAAPMRLERVLVNEGLVELVKALNQAGAALSWEEGDLISRGGKSLSVTDKAVYAGDDLLNFYLLAPLALTQPGSAKFMGAPGLKDADLRPLSRVLPQFGARLSCIVPKSWGLPARIEASGTLTDSIEITPDVPAEAVVGLALAAHDFDRGLRITWSGREELCTMLAQAAEVLTAFGIGNELADDSMTISQATPQAPADVSLELDAELAAPLLAMPLALHLADRDAGSVCIVGTWPAKSQAAAGFMSLFADAGVQLDVGSGSVTATVKSGVAAPPAIVAPSAQQAPLAVVLAAGWSISTASNVPVRMAAELAEKVVAPATELCARLGLTLTPSEVAGGVTLNFAPAEQGRENTAWLAPDAAWGLAFSVAALYRPGLGLGNPAVVSGQLPGYWPVYNGLPAPTATFFKYAKPKDTDNDAGESEPARRRIKL